MDLFLFCAYILILVAQIVCVLGSAGCLIECVHTLYALTDMMAHKCASLFVLWAHLKTPSGREPALLPHLLLMKTLKYTKYSCGFQHKI